MTGLPQALFLRHTSRPMDPQLLDDLVAANRILAEHGVIDAYGHVSLRHPDDPKRFLLARAIAPETVGRDDILEYDLDGNAIDARGRDSVSERFIHSEVYRSRPDVMSVVHNHSPSVIPFSVTGVRMRALFHMAAFIGEGLPNFEIRKVKKGSDLLVRDAKLGAALAKTLGKKPAALMRGHGSVVTGENLPRAVGRSIYLEASARMQMQAIWLSKSVTYLDAAEVKASAPVQDYKRAWPLWRAKALRKSPT
jgi:ribulose-5-phosphate 4-epimerase/fuculose-1-phosphate aldolase